MGVDCKFHLPCFVGFHRLYRPSAERKRGSPRQPLQGPCLGNRQALLSDTYQSSNVCILGRVARGRRPVHGLSSPWQQREHTARYVMGLLLGSARSLRLGAIGKPRHPWATHVLLQEDVPQVTGSLVTCMRDGHQAALAEGQVSCTCGHHTLNSPRCRRQQGRPRHSFR